MKQKDLAVKTFARDVVAAACGAGYKPVNLFWGYGGNMKTLWKKIVAAGINPGSGGIPLAQSIRYTDNMDFSTFDSHCQPVNKILDNFCATVDRGYRPVPGA